VRAQSGFGLSQVVVQVGIAIPDKATDAFVCHFKHVCAAVVSEALFFLDCIRNRGHLVFVVQVREKPARLFCCACELGFAFNTV